MEVSCFYMGLSWLPILFALILTSTLYITYFLATFNGQVVGEFTLIGTTGARPPESCILAQGFNLAAFVGAICVYIWHGIAMGRTAFMGQKQPRTYLRVLFAFGLLSCVGLTVAGNFQQTGAEVVHTLGGTIVLIGSVLYAFMLTHVCRKYLAHRFAYWTPRLCIALASFTFLIVFIGCYISSRTKLTSTRPGSKFNRRPDDGGFSEFKCASICEWTLVFLLIAFVLTMAPEFRRYALRLPQVVESTLEKNEA
ncbi:hypothetical protein EG68_02853 [Paragonimus skrjabini miyazakii]|uniref:CWH43-like N-terminal domain-containing protein n=1 Tax=Paragonimus skrjabini miyazakii TaxID=59628 RepID=A0A8S9Z8D1_9TREM|nr:hypothetical protein EG68_02853 [Paragonimus skrjabini miyazakii]